MDKKIENLIGVAKVAVTRLKEIEDPNGIAKALEMRIHEIESGDLRRRLKHIKSLLEDPISQFLLVDDGSDSTRGDLLEVVDYYLTSHKSE